MRYHSSQWQHRPSLRQGRIGLAGATLDGRNYAIAGFSLEPDRYYDNVEVRTNQPAATWHQLPPIPIARANCAADSLRGSVYVVGGLAAGVDEHGEVVNVVQDSVQRFDPRIGSWQASRALPTPRTHAGVAAHNGRLYVAGGADNGETNSMVAYDPSSDRWIELVPRPETLAS